LIFGVFASIPVLVFSSHLRTDISRETRARLARDTIDPREKPRPAPPSGFQRAHAEMRRNSPPHTDMTRDGFVLSNAPRCVSEVYRRRSQKSRGNPRLFEEFW
jgi:hypothetical protein